MRSENLSLLFYVLEPSVPYVFRLKKIILSVQRKLSHNYVRYSLHHYAVIKFNQLL